jgi:hypothetical protein
MKVTRAVFAILLSSWIVAQAQDTDQGAQRDAVVPIEVLDPDPEFVGEVFQKGIRWDAAVLAAQPARIAAGIVLKEAKGTIPSGSVLMLALLGKPIAESGKPKLDVALEQRAWCQDPSGGPVTVRCFQDLDGDSKLDAEAVGFLPRTDALSLNRIGPAKAITPVSYRSATPDELTKLRLDYTSCLSSDENLKYGLRIRRMDRPLLFGGSEQGECASLAPPIESADGKQVYIVGRMKIAVATENDRRTTRVIEGIPTGTVLGHVRADQPLTDVLATKGYSEQMLAKSSERPFLYFVNAALLPSEPIKAGQLVLSAEVAHGLTGRLRSDVFKPGWLASSKLPYFSAGTPVFGVEMSKTTGHASLEPNVVWCVPIGGKGKFTECMVKQDSSYLLAPAYTRFDVRNLAVSMNGNYIHAPVVEIGPVDFGAPLLLEIRFDEWKKREAIVSYRFELQGATEQYFKKMKLRRDDNGVAWLLIGPKPLAIAPSPSDPKVAVVTMTRELQPGDEAIVLDAYRHFKELRK